MASGFDAHQPRLRAFFRGDSVPDSVDIEPAMCAGTNAGIFLATPVNQVVPAFSAGPGVIGNLVRRQPMSRANFLSHVVERARRRFVRRLQFSSRMQSKEGRA